MKFVNEFVDKTARYCLGVEQESGTRYLSIPVSNNLTDYEEYYSLSEEEYAGFRSDRAAASEFAELCRSRELDDRLILKPGWNRGDPR